MDVFWPGTGPRRGSEAASHLVETVDNPIVYAKVGVNLAEHAEVIQSPQGALWRRFAKDEVQFVINAFAADTVEQIQGIA